MDELTNLERRVLEFERQWWKYAGAKEVEIRNRFGWSAVRYYQVVNHIIDKPAAWAHDPMLVKRLRRIRGQRNHRGVA